MIFNSILRLFFVFRYHKIDSCNSFILALLIATHCIMNTTVHLMKGEVKNVFPIRWNKPKLSANDTFKPTFPIGGLIKPSLKVEFYNHPSVGLVYCNLHDHQHPPSLSDMGSPVCRSIITHDVPHHPDPPSLKEACSRQSLSNTSFIDKRYNDHDDHVVTTHLENVSLGYGSFTGGSQKWRKGKIIGIGSYGIVHEYHDENGHYLAGKEVSLRAKGRHEKQRILQLQQEIYLLSNLSHPNIVRYLGTYKGDDKLYIFLELATKGSLAELYERHSLQDYEVSAYTKQILNGLRYLHERNMIHRDVKCANILVDVNGSVKLADFGMAKVTTLNGLMSCKGTVYWMAPEVVNSPTDEGYGVAADIWSLGCTVLEMLTRKVPYFPLEWIPAVLKISRGELPEIPKTLCEEAQDFVHKCLQVDPKVRPSATQLLAHPFLRRPTSKNSNVASPHNNGTHL